MRDIYSKWGNYIPQDIRKQFEKEWLEVEAENKEAMDMLLNIAYWDTCPDDYKDRIKLLEK